MTEEAITSLSRRSFLRAFKHVMIGGLIAGPGSIFYVTKVEPWWLKVAQLDITLPNLPPAFEGYRLIQLTDLHLTDENSRQAINHAVEVTLELAPDLIVLTGDYVTNHLDAPTLTQELGPLKAPDGVWAILGNHDYWTHAPGVRQVLVDAGIEELRNANTAITRAGQSLYLAGVDDIWEEHHDLGQALSGIPPDGVTILLAHEPDFADEVFPTGRIALQLSGHSHGGQVHIPLLGPPIVPDFAKKYPSGLWQLGEMQLYVNRGVGYLHPIRFNCRPEIALITLRRA